MNDIERFMLIFCFVTIWLNAIGQLVLGVIGRR